MSNQVKRLCAALLVVVVAVGAVLLLPAACETGQGDGSGGAGSSTGGDGALPSDNPVVAAFARAGGDVACGSEMPDELQAETFNPRMLGASRVMFRDGVVGLAGSWTEEEIVGRISQQMLSAGWVDASGRDDEALGRGGVTYMKSDGSYRWAYVFCQDGGTDRLVVMIVA